jgi:hypothetical protein
MDAQHAASLQHRYLIRFEGDTLRQRPLRIPGYFVGTWDIDPVHCHIGFEGRRAHNGISCGCLMICAASARARRGGGTRAWT